MLSIKHSLPLFFASNLSLFWSVILDVGSCFQIAPVQFLSRREMGLGTFLQSGQTEPVHHFFSPRFQKCIGLSDKENQNRFSFPSGSPFPIHLRCREPGLSTKR